jgi:hypothetical protein
MTQPASPLLSEPGQVRVLKVVCILFCMLSAGYASDQEGLPSSLSATNTPPQTISPETTQQSKSNETERAAALQEALQFSAKQAEDRARGIPLPPSQFPFPNYDAGPQRPLPNYLNFYGIDDRYPNYLLCEHPVDETNYNQSNELKWFETSLKQIRSLGPQKFPPINWVAVAIRNVAEHKNASTFEQSFKVGAIFKVDEVFDSSQNLTRLIAHAEMNRHPFILDPQRSKYIPMERQRWIIVEKHATNNPTTGSN